MTEEVQVKKKKSWFGRLLRWFFYVLLLLLLITLLLQLSSVQNWLGQKITNYLSDKTETNISFESVDVSVTKGIALEGFKMITEQGDTVISSSSLQVGLAKSLWSLKQNSLDLTDIQLTNPVVNIITRKGETKSNFSKILARLTQADKPENDDAKPLSLDLDKVNLQGLDLTIADENANRVQTFEVAEVNIDIEKMLVGGQLILNELKLDRPIVRLRKLGDAYELKNESVAIQEIIDTSAQAPKDSLWIQLGRLEITDGVFSMNDATKNANDQSNSLDYANFEFSDINLSIADLNIKEGTDIKLALDQLSLKDNKGGVIKKLSASSAVYNSKELSLEGFELVTKRSQVKRNVKLTYRDFADFADLVNKVRIDAQLDGTSIYIGDILHYAGGLEKNSFFQKNKNRYVELNGRFKGPIDRLSGKNVIIEVDDELMLEANFTTRNLTKSDKELINFGVKNLQTDMAFLRDFIPGFLPPENFYKLEDIDFKGRFDGYLKDFVAFGSLNTAMGKAYLDMRLDIKDGSEMANYNGELSLENFDLKAWSGSDDLGIANFSASIEDGYGLTLKSVDTELNAVVESITYKGYEYKDFVMDGHLNKNQFEGEFSITDDNIDLIFDGNIELIDKVPHLDFKANIERLDLEKLNLSKKPFVVKGAIDINGSGDNINTIIGSALASDLYIATNDTIYSVDTLNIESGQGANGNSLSIYSEVAEINLEGNYDLRTLVPEVKKLLKRNYQHYTQNWKIEDVATNTVQDVKFDLKVNDTKNLLELAGVPDLRVTEVVGKGRLNTKNNELSFEGKIPYVGFKNNLFNNTELLLASKDGRGDVTITIDSTNWGGRAYNPITIKSQMSGDTVNIYLGTSEVAEKLNKLELEAQLVPHEDGYALQLADREIEMLGTTWTFSEDNELIFGENYLSIDNMRLSDGNRSILLDDVDNKGVSLYLADFNIKSINGNIYKYKKMFLEGKGDLSLRVDDLYAKDKGLEANIFIPKFTINGDPFGTLELDVIKPANKPYAFDFSLAEDKKGAFITATFDQENNNYLDATVVGEDFNMKVFQYILNGGIDNVYGELDLNGTVKGPIDKMVIDAEAYLNNAGLEVVYTGADYTFDQQRLTCTEKIIDFTGAQLVDKNGNTGTITGGIYHDLFTKFSIDANLSGDDVIAVDTKKGDNEFYYGLAKGNVSVDFSGPFDALDMKIACTTKAGTELNIPISDNQKASDKNFIEFIDKETLFQEEVAKVKAFKLQGLDIEIDLTMTEDAQVNLIFDESRGDIIQGSGNGDLKMQITRYGDFDIYGNYVIAKGEYLFTAWGLVAKPFNVRRGSTIRWTGDPINAELNISADYSVRTPMRIFLNEYLVSGSQASAEANTRTEVDLVLDLSGTLFKPLINFDLDFPNITGELASVTENKMRVMRTNQSELNNQVVALIVFNTFFPSNGSGSTAGADLGSAGISTVSEFLSSQLSIVFTGLINDALAEDGLISGVDFEIGLNKNSFNGVNQTNTDLLPDEIEVNLKNRFRFLDERLSLGLGGNYVRQSVLATNQNYFVGDFVIEYFLSSDRKLKLKMYGKYDLDENVISRQYSPRYP